ncbi:arginine--tRNA ligase [Candidatus Poriferisodalis sp.]|uniref:arginine--tRNA ligase n=1 Tax=Candidatus Poriferisodalis sp. TaxID=3101277 RepID=UPI003B02ACE1
MEQALTGAIASALAGLGIDADASRLRLERPSRAGHGDWSSNAAMVYAKAAKMAPRELAERVVVQLELVGLPHLERAEVAGPGFVNVHLSPSWLHTVLETVLHQGPEGYACPALGNDATVNLEFVSANPTGPLHAGGGRWGAFGDSLARLFRRCGYQTHTEYYVNDRGTQLDLFGRSLAARVADEPVPDDGYHGEYVREWAAELIDNLAEIYALQEAAGDAQQQPEPVSEFLREVARRLAEPSSQRRRALVPNEPNVRDLLLRELEARGGVAYAAEWGRERALRDVSGVLAAMNVSFDHWQYETKVVEPDPGDLAIPMAGVLELLRDRGATYEQDGAVWLRTSKFGDDKDRVLIRSNGEPTYFLPDIAYHHAKFSRDGRDIDRVIDVLGADHHGYVARMAAAMHMLGHQPESDKPAFYEAIVGQNVTLMRDGQVIELSKRTGTMVEVRELIDAVGPDVARFAFLLQSIDTRQTIDIDLLSAQATENPVFYVQYAHARIASVQRKASAEGVESAPADNIDLALLVSEREIALMRALEVLPSVVELALRERAPHKVSTWVRDLAAAFHGFYHDCPILRSDVSPQQRDARLCLTEGTRIGLAIGLDLLGVNAPEQM